MAAEWKATNVWKKNHAPRSRKESVLLTQDVIALSLEYFLIALVNQDIMVTAKVRALLALQGSGAVKGVQIVISAARGQSARLQAAPSVNLAMKGLSVTG